jgi:hypothetical protein
MWANSKDAETQKSLDAAASRKEPSLEENDPSVPAVMAGLDPAIQPTGSLDARLKAGHDGTSRGQWDLV